MSTPQEIVKQLDQAFSKKDETAYRNMLHPNYSFKGPMMACNSREEAVAFMMACPLKFHSENGLVIAQDNNVVHMFDWVVESPFQGRFRMAEYLSLENGQVRSSEMFYDTAAFPKEFMAEMCKEKAAV